MAELTDSRHGSWVVTTADAVWQLDLDARQVQTTLEHSRRSVTAQDRKSDAGTLAFVAQCRVGEPLIVFVGSAGSGDLDYRITGRVERIVAADDIHQLRAEAGSA